MLSKLIKRIPIAYYPYKPFMHQYKCIFIHIPKNAGSSILKLFLDKGGRKHAKWYDFYESNDYFYNKYTKFAIIREPISRIYSAYSYALSGGNQSETDINLKKSITSNSNDFNEFVDKVLTFDFIIQQPLFTPQYLYIFDRELNCQIDHLLRYETLSECWLKFATENKLPRVLPWENKSGNKANLSIMNQSTVTKLNKLYKLDFKLLNY